MRKGCQVMLFGRPQGPVRDNLDEAMQDALRLKLGRYDDDGRFFLDAGADFQWRPIEQRVAA